MISSTHRKNIRIKMEEDLETSLKGHRMQLAQINEMLQHADTMEKLELYDLEKDMKELIKVTEEQLLTLKKEKLLSSLMQDESVNSTLSESLNRPSQTTAEVTQNSIVNMEHGEMFNDYVGLKCRVQYTQSWGSFQSHNAMVLSIEEILDDQGEDLHVKVRVLFLNPIHISMVPCQYYLDAKCHYTEEDCKYSHGYVTSLDELQEYQDPDFKHISIGSKCLAKHGDDGVWYTATIIEAHEEQAEISFHTNKTLTNVTLDYHDIFPLVEVNESSDTSDSEVSSDETTTLQQQPCKTMSLKGPMGEWEEHTKGIGSKLMANMGYIIGRGLGKYSNGKIDPVEINLLPAGKSLDAIMELREKGKIKDPTKRKSKKKIEQQMEAHVKKKVKENSAFDLINTLAHKKASAGQGSSSTSSTRHNKPKADFSVEDSYKQHKSNKSRQRHNDVREKEKSSSLNIQMLKNSEKISNLKKNLVKLKESLARNPGNTTISRTIQHNMTTTQSELEQLLMMDTSIQQKLHLKQQSKKLSVF